MLFRSCYDDVMITGGTQEIVVRRIMIVVECDNIVIMDKQFIKALLLLRIITSKQSSQLSYLKHWI